MRRGVFRLCLVALAAGLLLPATQRAEAQTILTISGPQTLTETDANADLTYTITRVGDAFTDASTTINLALTHVTTEDADITVPASVIFLAGADMQTFTITVIGDNLNEATEGFTISTSGGGSNVSHNTAHGVAIVDDDDIEVTIARVGADNVDEAATVDFSVALDGGVPTTFLMVSFVISGTLSGAEYDVTVPPGSFAGDTGGMLSFGIGETASLIITVDLIGDTTPEASETLTITGQPLIGTGAVAYAAGGDSATVTVIDDDPATVRTLTVTGASTHAETDANTDITYTVGLTGTAFTNPTAVTWTVTPGTAAAADFAATTGTITFPTVTTFAVTVVGDNLTEADETFTVNVSVADAAADGGTAIGPAQSTTITDDDAAAATTLAITGPTMFNETDANADLTYTITRTGDAFTTDTTITLTLGVDADGATADADLTGATADVALGSATVTFGPTDTTQTFTVTVTGDNLNEATETFTVVTSGGGGVTHGAALATTIADDDTIGLSTNNRSITLDEGGTVTGNVISFLFIATLTEPIEVTYTIAPISGSPNIDGADPADYTDPNNGRLTIPAGQPTAGGMPDVHYTIPIMIVDDNLHEREEGFVITFAATSAGAVNFVAGNSYTVTIRADASDLPARTLTVTGAGTHAETDADTVITYTVGLTGTAFTNPTDVTWTVTPGTAAAADFAATTGTITFPTVTTFDVTVAGDNLAEGNETFTVNLSVADITADGGTGIGADASTTITDDDSARTLTVTGPSTHAETDANTDITYTVGLSGTAFTNPTAVTWTVTPVLATASDFAATTGTITFPTVTTFDVTVVGDNLFEGDETFTVNVSVADAAADGGTAIGPAQSTTITNDDAARTLTVTGPATIAEGTAGVESSDYTVALTGMTFTAATAVTWTVAHGATADADFVDASDRSGTLMFGTTNTSMTFTLTVAADMLNEADEGFTVQVSVADATADGGTTYGAAHSTSISDATDDAIEVTIARVGAANVNEAATADFSVTLSGGVRSADLTVPFTFSGTLDNAEYDITAPSGILATATGGTLTFGTSGTPLATDSLTVTANLVDDTMTEAAETLTITGGSLSTAGAVSYASGGDTAMVTVDDDDAAAARTLTVTGASTHAETDANTDITYTVGLSGTAFTNPTDVTWTVTPGTAAAADFAATTGTITFPTMTTFDVTVVGDNLTEGNETFTVNVSVADAAADGGTAIGPAQSTTITDDDTARTLTVTGASTHAETDANTDITYTVGLTGTAFTNPTAVTWTVTPGTAAAADFAATTGTITFPTVTTFAVTVVGDNLIEADETFTVNVSVADVTADGGTAIGADASTTITDDDSVRTLTVTGASTHAETDANTDITYTVGLTGTAFTNPTAVTWTVTPGTAAAADFAATTGTITFPTVTTFDVTVVGDNLTEADETFTVNVSVADAAADGGTAIGPAQSTTITDDDAAAATTLAITGPTMFTETDANADLTYTITRSGDAFTTDTTINLTLGVDADGATADADLTGATADVALGSATVTFGPTDTMQTFTVTVTGDNLNEATETFTVVTSGGGVTHGAAFATTITDDDLIGFVFPGAINVNEGDTGMGRFNVIFATPTEPIELTYTITPSSAGAETADYTDPNSGSITFAAGATSGVIPIMAVNDPLHERAEQFVVTITAATTAGAVNIADAEFTFVINADASDLPARTLTVTGATTIAEGAAGVESGAYTVALMGTNFGSATAVTWTVTNVGTADADFVDASDRSGTLMFGTTNTSMTFTLTVAADMLNEADEDFTVQVSVADATADGGTTYGAAHSTSISDAADDAIEVTIARVGAANVNEAATADFSVTLSGGVRTADLIMPFDFDGALNNAEYDITMPNVPPDVTGAFLAFPVAGTPLATDSMTITVNLIGDTVNEAAETLTLTGAPPDEDTGVDTAGVVRYATNGDSAMVTVTDDDPIMVTIARVGAANVNEAATANFSVTLAGGVRSADLTVPFDFSGTLDNAEYDITAPTGILATATGGTLTFGTSGTPLATDSLTVTANLVDDTTSEAAETLTITGGSLSTAGAVSYASGGDTAMVTVDDDDAAAGRTLTVTGPATIAEGAAGVESSDYTVALTGNNFSATTAVTWTVTNVGTADADFVDASDRSGTVMFGTTNTSMTFTLTVASDTLNEADEDFTVQVSVADATADGGTTYGAAHSTSISDATDDAIEVTIARVGMANVGEAATANFSVTLAGGVRSADLTVPFTFSGTLDNAEYDITAPTGIGATATGGTLTFGTSGTPMATDSLTVTANLMDDTTSEAAETLTITGGSLSTAGAVSYATGGDTAMVTVDDDDAAAATFAISGTPSAAEGGSLTFSVLGSGSAPSGAVTATCTVSGAGVTAGDFSATSGGPVSATFPAPTLNFTSTNYMTAQNCVIHTFDDTTSEGAEDFTVTLTVTGGGAMVDTANNTATGTIQASDQPAATTFSISGTPSAAEGGSLTFPVVGSGGMPSGAVTATCTVSGAGVTAGDFSATSGGPVSATFPAPTLTFTMGDYTTAQNCVIHTFDDTTAEGSEAFTVTLTVTGSSTVGTATATGTIQASDQPTTFSISGTPSAAEGGSLTFPVVGSGAAPSGAVTATCTVSGAGVTAGDFSATSGGPVSATFPAPTLTFTMGDYTTAQNCVIHTFDDTTAEGSEAFTVTLTVTGSSTVGTATATGTIQASDQPTTFSISGTPSAAEGGSLTFPVVGSGGMPSGAVTATCTVSGAGVTAGDFSATSGGPVSATFPAPTLTFTMGDYTTAQNCVIHTFDDTTAEGSEAFTVTLTVTGSSTVGTATATGTIQASDQPTTFSISGTPSAAEGGSLTFPVVGSGGMPSGAVTATCTVSGAGVTAGDFSATSGGPVSATFPAPTLTFTMGDYTTAQNCVIHTFDDTTAEGSEDFTVTLTVTGSSTVGTATATGTIQASDQPAATTFSISGTPSAAEGGSLTFPVVGSGGMPSGAVTATCTVSGAGVTAGDFSATSGGPVSATFPAPTLTFTMGDYTTAQNCVIHTFDDTTAEGSEDFTVTLTVTGSSTVGTATATGTIQASDQPAATTFSISGTPSAAEGGSLTFPVVGSGGMPSGAVTATCTVSGAGVTAGDFSATSGGPVSATFPAPTLTFTMGDYTTAQNCVIHTFDDTTAEGSEDFTVTLTVTGSSTVGTATATGTIQASDQPAATTFSISGTPSAAEGGSLTFPVVGSGGMPSGAVTATCTVSGAGVTAGDFSATSGGPVSATFPAPTLTFTMGDYTTAQNCVIHTFDDTTAEGSEDFTVTLTVSGSSTVGTATATGTIQASDQPAATTFSISGTPSAAEGGSLTFPVVGSGGMPSGAVTATCTVSGAGVTAGDFSATSGGPVSATFPAPTLNFTSTNYMTAQNCVIHTFDDTTSEGSEDFTVTLTVTGGGAMVDTANNTATGTIQASDQPAATTFSISGTPSAAEGGSLTFPVVGSGSAPSGAVTATCTVSGAGVTAGDFSATSGGPVSATFPAPTLTFTMGDYTTAQNCVIHTFDDTTAEGSEDFTVTLTVSGSSTVGTATATGTIQASDQPAATTFSISGTPSAAEGGSLTFPVVGSGAAPSGAVTATCTVSGAGVTAGDFSATSGGPVSATFPAPTLTFTMGDYTTAQDCVIHTFDDTTAEGSEDFTVTLTVTGSSTVGTATATGTIQASDQPAATTFSISGTPSAAEGGSLTFPVVGSGGMPSGAVTATCTVSGAGVTAGDFSATSGGPVSATFPAPTLTFTMGDYTTAQDCVIHTFDDTTAEGSEDFTVTLTVSGSSTVGTATATGTIQASDQLTIFTIGGPPPAPSAAEGGSLTFSVLGSGSAPSGAVTATCTVGGTGVTAGDFSVTSGGPVSATFPAPTLTFTSTNYMVAQNCIIHTFDDMAAEGDEDFTVTLMVTGGGATEGTPSTATGTIQASDQPPTFAISGTPRAAEGGSLTFGVVGSGLAPSGAVTATCTVSGAGVTVGDFRDSSSATMPSTTFPAPTLTFNTTNYTTSQNCVVYTYDDETAEGNEAFTVTLTVMGGGAMADTASNTATGTIQASDQPVTAARTVRMEQAATSLNRAAVTLSVPVIARRFDPGRGLASPGLALNLDSKQVLAPPGGVAASGGAGAGGYAAIGLPKSAIPAPQSAIPAKAGIQHTNSPAPAGHQPDAGVGAVPASVAGAVLAQTPGGALSAAPAAPPAAGGQGGQSSLLDMGALAELAASQLEGLDSLSPSTESRTLQQLLGNSSFSATSDRGGGRTLSVWGRGSYTSLDGEPEEGGTRYDYDGDSYAFYLGLDGRYGDYLAGLAVGYTVGDLELRTAGAAAGDRSDFESDLVAVYPYASWQPSDRLSVWVLGGYGQGELEIEEREGGAVGKATSDTDLWLGAAGLSWRRPVADVDMLLRLSGTALHGETDGGTLRFGGGMPDETYSETETDAQQLRGEMELGRVFGFEDGGRLRPYLTAGVSYDFGDGARDAATGEFGTGFQLHWPRLGLETELEFQARLSSKDDRDYQEYTGTGTLRYDLGGDRRGLQLAVAPAFGLAQGVGLDGADGLGGSLDGGAFGGAPTSLPGGGAGGGLGSGPGNSFGLHSELSYGIGNVRALRGLPGLLTLYGAGGLSAGAGRDLYRSGVRFEAARFTLDAGLRHESGGGDSDTGFLLDGAIRF